MEESVVSVIEAMIVRIDAAIEQQAKKVDDCARIVERQAEYRRATDELGLLEDVDGAPHDPYDPPEWPPQDPGPTDEDWARELDFLQEVQDEWVTARRILMKIRMANILRQSEWIALHHDESDDSLTTHMIVSRDHCSRISIGRSEGDTSLSELLWGCAPLLDEIGIPGDYDSGRPGDRLSDVTILYDRTATQSDSVVEDAWLVAVNVYTPSPDPEAPF